MATPIHSPKSPPPGEPDPKKREEKKPGQTSSTREKIVPPEIIFFGLWSGFADIFEIVGVLAFTIPYVGQALWIIAVAFGALTSAVIAIWLWFHGGSFGAAKKLVVFLIGSVFDSLTTGVLPLRTISLFVAIWVHNHPKLTALATSAIPGGKIAKVVGKAASVVK